MPKSSSRSIDQFALLDPPISAAIDQERVKITLTVPVGTNLETLAPSIQFTGKKITPASETAQDFFDPVPYVVEAENGKTTTYTAVILPELKVSPEIDLDFYVPPGSSGTTVTGFNILYSSTYKMSSLTARLGDQSWPLTWNTPNIGKWGSEDYNLPMVPNGVYDLVVTATDVVGNVSEVSKRVRLYHAPQLVLSEPSQDSVARPSVFVRGTVTGGQPADPVSFLVTVDDPSNNSHTTVLTTDDLSSQEVDLSAWDGKGISLMVDMWNSKGHWYTSRRILVENSPQLVTKAVVSGKVLGADQNRVLYSDTSSGKYILKVLNLSDQTIDVVDTGDLEVRDLPIPGWLTPGGVCFPASDGAFYLWNTSQRSVALLMSIGGGAVQVAGAWLAVQVGNIVTIGNLTTGTTQVATNSLVQLYGGATLWRLTSAGDLYYFAPNNGLFHWTPTGLDQISHPIGDNPSSDTFIVGLVAQGTHLGIVKKVRLPPYYQNIYVPTSYVIDLVNAVPAWKALPDQTVEAFLGNRVVMSDDSGLRQVTTWTSDLQNRSPFSPFAWEDLRLITDDGAALFIAPNKRFYLWKNGDSVALCPDYWDSGNNRSLVTLQSVGGHLYVALGNTLLEYEQL